MAEPARPAAPRHRAPQKNVAGYRLAVFRTGSTLRRRYAVHSAIVPSCGRTPYDSDVAVDGLLLRLQKVAVIVLIFALMILNFVWVLGPVHRWAVLHTTFTAAQIREQDIRLTRVIRPHGAEFSNGERHEYTHWVEALAAVVWLGGAGVAACIGRAVFPKAYASLSKRDTPARPRQRRRTRI